MVDPDDVALSLTRQCRLVSIARSSFYYEGKDESLFNVQLLRRIDEQFLETPFYGSRQMTRWLRPPGDMGQPQASPAPDAALGPAGDLPTAPDVSAAPRAPDLPIPAARPGDHAAESGVVFGRDVHSAGARLSLPGRGHGLGEPEGLSLEAVKHARLQLLCRSLARGARPLRVPRDLQYRPGQPIHESGLHRRAHGRWDPHLNGRQGPLDG